MPASPQQSAYHRRSAARTAVVRDALGSALGDLAAGAGHGAGHGVGRELDVLDVGGGTGGLAVWVAELGHRVVVVDPSPDALAILARRSEEAGVADRVRGVQGDLDGVASQVPEGGVDVVLCHGVLEVVDDPRTALRALHGVLRPGGVLSLLVSQRHAAVVARAMAGHFRQARTLLDEDPLAQPPSGGAGGPHRLTADEVARLLTEVGLEDVVLHAVRVFSDLVPSSLVDLEPGAAGALAELEEAVATRPEYLALATQVHALAHRPG